LRHDRTTCPHCRVGRQSLCHHAVSPGRRRVGGWAPVGLVTRQIGLGDVTDTLRHMMRFEAVGFVVITKFA